MIVKFDESKLEHLKYLSRYNHNYYKLPLTFNDCSILYVEWVDDDYMGDYYFGNFDENGEFISKYLYFGDINGNVDLINNKQ